MTGDAALSVAILAGGGGRRLGGVQKPLLEIGGATILERQLAALAPLAAAVAVLAPDPEPLKVAGLAAVRDLPGATGPLAGIAAALRWSPAPWLLAVAGDMPFVSAAAVAALFERSAGADLVAPEVAGRLQPLFALYRVAATADAAAELAAAGAGPRALFAAAAERGLRAAIVDEAALRARLGDLRALLGVNTPSELERARALAR